MPSSLTFILNFVYNHAAPRHCLNKFRHCSRLAVYFNDIVFKAYMLPGGVNPIEKPPGSICALNQLEQLKVYMRIRAGTCSYHRKLLKGYLPACISATILYRSSRSLSIPCFFSAEMKMQGTFFSFIQ